MKYKHYSTFCLVLGLMVTLTLTWLHWSRTLHGFHMVNERRHDVASIMTHESVLQHALMLKLIQSFFKASERVTQEEFTRFTSDLFEIKSGIAFTLDDKHNLGYISAPNFAKQTAEGTFFENRDGGPDFELANYLTHTVAIDSSAMAYLVYLVPPVTILESLNNFDTYCIELTVRKQVFNNRYCEENTPSLLQSLFVNQSLLDKLKSPVRDTVYTLSTWSLVSSADIGAFFFAILLRLTIGVGCSVLMYFKLEQSLSLYNMRIEIESKMAVLSTINHEIRTPINAVLGYSKMLKERSCCSRGEATIDKIIWSANLLHSVAENSLNFSKASIKELSLNQQTTNLRQVIDDITDYYAAFSRTHDRELHVVLNQTLPECISIDSTKLFQVITNIINNAFKYSSGDHVDCHVRVKHHGSTRFVRVGVRDFGEGMTKASIAAIARPFATRLHNSTTKQSGLGIGLYICKKMLESVGGSIRIRSRTNQGTLVIIRFPYQVIESTEDPIEELASIKTSSSTGPIWLGDNGTQVADTQVMDTQVMDNGVINTRVQDSGLNFNKRLNKHRSRSILLVDDNLFNLEVAKASLEQYDFSVSCEHNAQSTLEYCSRVMPEIVLMDYRLEDTNGLALIDDLIAQQALAAATAKPSTHYFILSANDKLEIPQYAQYPHVSFLQKPLNVGRLLKELDRRYPDTRTTGMS